MDTELSEIQPIQSEPQYQKPEGFFRALVVAYKRLTVYKGDWVDAFFTPGQAPCSAVKEDVWFLQECPQCKRKHVAPLYLVYLEMINIWLIKPIIRVVQALLGIASPILGPLFVIGRKITVRFTKEIMQKKKQMERQAAGVPQSPSDIQQGK